MPKKPDKVKLHTETRVIETEVRYCHDCPLVRYDFLDWFNNYDVDVPVKGKCTFRRNKFIDIPDIKVLSDFCQLPDKETT